MKTYDERTQAVMNMVETKRKRHRAIVAATTSSAVCVFVLVMSLVLFLPFSTPSGGTYGNVLSALSFDGYRNNWELWTSSLGTAKSSVGYLTANGAPSRNDMVEEGLDMYADSANVKGNARGHIDEANANLDEEKYVENTNLQVLDVREGDVLKESTHYFYRLRAQNDRQGDLEYYFDCNSLQLDVFLKAGKDTHVVATYRYAPQDEIFLSAWEMYLNDACDTLTVLFCDRAYWRNARTGVLTISVADLDNVHLVREKFVSGAYASSRVIEGKLLLATNYRVYDFYDIEDYTDYRAYVPLVREGDDVQLIAPEEIMCPERVDSVQYTVMTYFDADLSLLGQTAMLGYDTDVIYVNQSRAYVACEGVRAHDDQVYTDVTCVGFGANGLHLAGNFEVAGRVSNQYWMDEYEGVLRVAATNRSVDSVYDEQLGRWKFETNASLYCYRVGSWDMVAKVERFAPEGESVQSARFVGAKAYVCTALVVEFRDPVYCFDLSNYAHITHTDTGAIDGYSTSLVPFADDTLLGVGVERDGTVKLELYRETDTDVVSVSAVTLGKAETNVRGEQDTLEYDLAGGYKSYLLDAAHGIVGVPCYSMHYAYNANTRLYACTSRSVYALCVWDGSALRLAAEMEFENGVDHNTRAVVRDGYVYVFTQYEMQVLTVDELN